MNKVQEHIIREDSLLEDIVEVNRRLLIEKIKDDPGDDSAPLQDAAFYLP